MLLVNLAATSISGDTHDWPAGLAMLLSAVPVYFAGWYLNGRAGRVMIDKATGREIVIRRTDPSSLGSSYYWAEENL